MSFGVLLRQVFVKNIVHLRLRESKLKVVLYLQELKIFYYSEVTCKKVTGLRQCLPAWRGGGTNTQRLADTDICWNNSETQKS